MISVWQDYYSRVEEINLYFDFIENYENESDDLYKILKANAFLLLYNLIESTVRNSIEEIHSALNNENIVYSEVIDEIRAIWIEFYFKKFKNKSAHTIAKEINEIASNVINIDYSKYIEKVKSGDFSGNLDKRKINDLSIKYNFESNKRITGRELFIVKQNRNRLAHGEISFRDLGKNYDKSDLIWNKRICVLYLKEMLISIEKYINNKKFKR